MKLREQKKAHNEKLTKLRELEKRDALNEQEQAEWNSLYSEVQALKTEIEKRQRIKELELATVPDIPKSEKRNYSLTNAIQCLLAGKKSGYEGEMHEELERRGHGISERGFLIPASVIFGKPMLEKRVVDGATSLISDPVRGDEFLPGLYNASVLPKLGVKMISAQGDFSVPKSGGISSSWFTGDGGSATTDKITESDPTYSSQELTAKFLGCLSGWSLKMLKQLAKNDLSVESLLREDMQMEMGTALDAAFFSEADTTNAPSSIKVQLGSGQTTAKDLDAPQTKKWELSDLTSEIETLQTASKGNLSSLIWCISPKVRKELSEIQKFSSSDGKALFDDGKILDLPTIVSTRLQPPATATADDGLIEVLVGDWSQVLVAQYGSVEISLGLQSDDFARGISRLRAISCFDWVVRRNEFFRMIRVDRKA